MSASSGNDHRMWVSVGLLMIAIISVQTGAAFAKQLLPVLGAPGTTTLRLCFATLILGVVCRPWRVQIPAPAFRSIAWYGLTIGGMNLFIYLALERIPLGVAVALEFLGPLTVAVLSSRRKQDFLWIGMATAGVIMLLPQNESFDGRDWLGVVYALLAAACWGFYILAGRRAAVAAPGGAVASIGMLAATLAIVPVGIATSGMKLLETEYWPMALSIALLSSSVPYYLEVFALKSLPARTFGILMSLEPAVAALSGLVILHELLTSSQVVAIILIMLASLGSVVSVSSVKRVHD